MRKFEEKTVQVYVQQKIKGFCHLYIGQEAIVAGTVSATKKEDKLYVYGNTNRATYFFEKNVLNILDTLQTEVVKFETESRISGIDKN
jgi:hypothetical protein